jgi:N-acetyl-gamma-glutamyl-phosphate reductase
MMNNKKNINSANIAILGASGYTGLETIRLLCNNINYNIVGLTADTKAGMSINEIYPHLNEINLPNLKKIDDIDYFKIDAVVSCLPHGKTQKILSSLPKDIKICDLSADFRFNDITSYEKVYEKKHEAIDLQKEAIYGLTEINRNAIAKSRFIANPGCYPTSALLPLMPLIKKKIIRSGNIVIDSKSGVSGAGRKLKENLLFGEISEGFSAYGLVNHRHRPEIQGQINNISSSDFKILFTPHLLPIKRGILSTIYLDISEEFNLDDVKNCLNKAYSEECFISYTDTVPSTHEVRGTNFCKMTAVYDEFTNKIIIISVIDNLIKGASGQAIQNLNLMLGFKETDGLINYPMFP